MSVTALTALSPKEKAQLVNYNAAAHALEKAVKIDDVKGIRDVSVAWRAYATQAKDTKLREWADELKLRAERKAGEMLIAMREQGELYPRGNLKGEVYTGGAARVRGRSSPAASSKPKLEDLGVTRQQASDWQKLARQPVEQFEKTVADAKVPRSRSEPDDDAPTREEIDDANTTARSRIFLRFAADTLRKLEHGAGLKKSKRGEISPEIKKALNDLVRACTKLRDDVLNRKE